MPLPLIIVLSVVLGLIVIILIISLFVYFAIFYSPNKYQKRDGDFPDATTYSGRYNEVVYLIEKLRNEPCEDVYIKSFDKVMLRGRYYHQDDNAPLAICFHGYRGTPIRDFCGGYQILKEKGFNILLIDERAHLKSKGHTITFGVKEARDGLYWINYAINRFGSDIKIILVGISMGGYTVGNIIMNNNLPNNVKGAMLDCPYYYPKDMLKTSCIRDLHIPWSIGSPILNIASRLYGHFSFANKKYDLTNKKACVDFIVIHGDKDSIVPCEFSENLTKNNPLTKRYVFPDADHGMSYLVDKDRYKECCIEFIDRVIN